MSFADIVNQSYKCQLRKHAVGFNKVHNLIGSSELHRSNADTCIIRREPALLRCIWHQRKYSILVVATFHLIHLYNLIICLYQMHIYRDLFRVRRGLNVRDLLLLHILQTPQTSTLSHYDLNADTKSPIQLEEWKTTVLGETTTGRAKKVNLA